MQPVADLGFFQLAKKTVELLQRFVRVALAREAAILVEAEIARTVEYLRPQRHAAAGVDIGGLEIFIDQAFERIQITVAAGARERRRQMIDDDGGTAALSLRAFTGIVHDEGVDVRQGPECCFRKTRARERQRLAGQPLHIAVLAHMDHGMGIERAAQPAVERQVAVRRRQIGVVIARLRVDVVAPAGLDTDDDIAEPVRGNCEAVRLAVKERIALRRTPARGHSAPRRIRQRTEKRRVVLKRIMLGGAPVGARGQVVGRPLGEHGHERRTVRRCFSRGIAGTPQRFQHADGAGGGVEPDAVAEAPVLVGVVGEHEGDTPRRYFLATQARPIGGECRGEVDAVLHRRERHDTDLAQGIEARFRLKRHRTAQHTAIHFRERDVHGDVAGAQAPRAARPVRFRAAREHDLQDGRIRRIERCCGGPARLADGKACCVQNDVGRRPANHGFDERRRLGLLQAAHEDRNSVEALAPEGGGKRVDRRRAAALQERAVERDQRRRARGLDAQVFQRARAHARHIDARAGQRLGLPPSCIVAD